MDGGFPTKSNLLQSKHTLELAELGYDLLDRKRNIILREMLRLMDEAGGIRGEVETAFSEAYEALRLANISAGQSHVLQAAETAPIPDNLTVLYRSVMGIKIPDTKLGTAPAKPHYGFHTTNILLDDAYIKFMIAKRLAVKAAAVENSIYRLATSMKQVKKRANALRDIVIPKLEGKIAYISSSLEEKERDEFTALKVIKARMNK
jgi:V/A-type H+-transporting ATPase subunit D